MADPEVRVQAALDRLAGDLPAIGIALSGGGDSTALMHMAKTWARGRPVLAATVDHALRPDSAAEAQAAGLAAQALDIPHTILTWQHEGPAGNLMANARDARLRLLSAWARDRGLPAVLLGHTRDDQAETLLMRLMRGAGVDGLAGMGEGREAFGIRWLRPMLDVGRAELRGWLTARGIGWIDDPTNEKVDFDRIRLRKAMEAMGIDAAPLALSARNIAQARDALAHYAGQTVTDAHADRGSLILPRAPFDSAPPEVQRRILTAAARWISGADYPARRATVLHALAAVVAGDRATLDGALFHPLADHIRVIREPAAALRAATAADGIWDGRWCLTGLSAEDEVTALGFESLTEIDWRGANLTRDEAAATPAIRRDRHLLAAPVLRPQAPWAAEPLRDIADFLRLVHHR